MKKRMICLLLCIMMLVSLLPTGAVALGETVIARDKAASERDNVQMSKMVREHCTDPNDPTTFDGSYDIVLEAYANAYYKPVDVVLVVDQSGSMTDNYGGNKKTNLANLKTALNTFAGTLKDVDEANTLSIIGFADSEEENNDFDNTELFVNGSAVEYGQQTQTKVYDLDTDEIYCTGGGKYVYYQNNSWGYYSGGCFSSSWKKITPKTSAGGSGEQLYAVGPTAEQYRTAAAKVTVNGQVNSTITTAISNLSGDGATYTNYGMLMAEKALASRVDQSRDAIVVLFTDGYPGDSAGSPNETAANLAIKYANKIKSNYKAKIYTVGLKGDDYSSMKTFLTKIQTPGSDYSYNTDDSQYLPDLFKMIYKDVIGVNENMTSSVKLVETLSDKFELNGDLDTAVTVSRVPYLGKDSSNTIWDEANATVLGSSDISKSQTDDVITVTGFDYAKIALDPTTKQVTADTNAVYYDSQGGNHGAKLRVVINVKPKAADNSCWEGVAFGKLEIVPTELSQLKLGNKEVAAIKSSDSDYFKKFEVELHHLLVSVADKVVLANNSKQTGETAVNLTPYSGYTVSGYTYTPAEGKTATAQPYVGSFANTDQISVSYTKLEDNIQDLNVTKKSVVKFVPGTLKVLESSAYVVTVNGNHVSVTYDGKEHSTKDAKTQKSFTYTVTKDGATVSDCVLGTDFTVNAPEVSKTDAGEYKTNITCENTGAKNIIFVINNGVLTINKVKITMTSASATKVYDETALTKNNVETDMVVTPGFVEGEGVYFTIKGSQTDIGTSDNWFTYTPWANTKMSNYIVTERMGTLTVYNGTGLGLSFYDKLEKKNTYHTDDTKNIIEGKTLTLDLNGGVLDLSADTSWTPKRNNAGTVLGYAKKVTEAPNITYVPTKNNYIFDGWEFSQDTGGNVTLKAKWLPDTAPADQIPDPYEKTITFKVVNGKWDDNTDTDKAVYIELKDAQDAWSETGSGKLVGEQIPAVGTKPVAAYQAGAWDTTPDTTTAIAYDADGTYTYTYAPVDNELTYPGGPKQNTEPPYPNYSPKPTMKTGNVLTLNLDGGAFASGDITALGTAGWNTTSYTKTITANDDSLVGKIPTKSGSVFDGWSAPVQTQTAGAQPGDMTITAKWEKDEIGGEDPQDPKYPGDGTPDKYQITVTFHIVNGKWGSSADDVKVVLTRTVGGAASGAWGNGTDAWACLAAGDIPNNMAANPGYGSGTWDTTPTQTEKIKADTTYKYTFAVKENELKYDGPLQKVEPEKQYKEEKQEVTTGKKVILALNGGNMANPGTGVWDDNTYGNYGGYVTKNTVSGDMDVTGLRPTKPHTTTGAKWIFNGWTASDDGDYVVLTAQWLEDKISGPDGQGPADDIPDPYQAFVNFIVVNGSLTNTSFTFVKLLLKDADGNLDANGTAKLSAIPADKTDMTASANYGHGSWGETVPSTATALTKNNNNNTYSYTFTYVADRTVTYPKPLFPTPTEPTPTLQMEDGKTLTLLLDGGAYSQTNALTLTRTYKWTYKATNGSYSKPITADTNITGAEYAPAKDGFVFNGWSAPVNDGNGNYTLTAQWLKDTIGPGDEPDGIPDDYQFIVTFKITNGVWKSGTTDKADKKVVLTKKDNAGNLSLTGSAKLTNGDIPQNMSSDSGYAIGKWHCSDQTLPAAPDTAQPLTENTVYIYSFAQDQVLSYLGYKGDNKEPQNDAVTMHYGKTITLILNGGTFPITVDLTGWAGNATTGYTRQITSDLSIYELLPEQSGYAFNGWKFSWTTTEADGNVTLTAQWKNASIWGIVKDNNVPEAGILVKLCQGNTVLKTALTDATGYYCFKDVAVGEYDIVAVKDLGKTTEKTKTAIVAVTTPGVPKEVNINLPQSGVSSVLVVEGTKTPEIVVGKLDELAKDRSNDTTINSKLSGGAKLEVKLKTKAVDYNAGDTAMFKVESQKEADGRTYIDYFDFKLLESLTGCANAYTDKDIGALDLNTQLLQVNIPFTTSGRKNFVVYRNHNGVVSTLTETPNTAGEYIVVKTNLITIFAKQFSVYAVAYDNVGGSTPGPSPSPAPGGGGGAPAADVYNIYAPKTTKNGQATVSTDTSPAGETITVKTVSDKGYKATVTVTDKNGKTVTVTDAGNGVFTFVMPEADVNVKIKFVCLRDKYCPIEPFDDTLNDYWWHDGVHFCVEEKYMIGFPNGDFRPYALTNRAQIAAIFWRIEGSPVVDYDITFKDLQPNAWYTEAIRWAEMNHVVYGYSEDAFGPEDPVTREQLAAIIYRYAQSKGEGLTGTWSFLINYTDKATISNWAYDAACWCSLQNIVVGDEGAYKPLANATRAEAACMIQRFCETILGM